MNIEIIFQGYESFVGLRFLDLENETFLNISSIYDDFEPFYENLKNGSIYFFKALTHICQTMLTISFQSFIN